MKRIILLATVAAMMAAMVVWASPVQAQDISLHQHVLTTPGQNVELAQGFCRGAAPIDPALEEVHQNVHLGEPGTAAFNQPNNPVSEAAAPC